MTRKSFALLTLTIVSAPVAAAPPPERIAPANTIELTVANDLATLETHFARTQFAKLYADPAMTAFFNGAGAELFGLFELPDAIGLKWAGLKQISGRPIASISMPLSGQQLGTVVAIDIAGHADMAKGLVAAGIQNAKRAGAVAHDQSFAGNSGTVLDLPDAGNRRRPVGILFKDERLLIADPPEAIGPILTTWANPQSALAESPAYKSVRSRTAMKPGETADLIWYFDPFGWDAATRPPVVNGKRKRNKEFVEILRQEGFDGVKAIGGAVAFSAAECDLLVRLAVYAPKPYRSCAANAELPPGHRSQADAGLAGRIGGLHGGPARSDDGVRVLWRHFRRNRGRRRKRHLQGTA